MAYWVYRKFGAHARVHRDPCGFIQLSPAMQLTARAEWTEHLTEEEAWAYAEFTGANVIAGCYSCLWSKPRRPVRLPYGNPWANARAATPNVSNTIGVPEAARQLGCTTPYIRKFIRQGRVNAMKVGREWFIALPFVVAPPSGRRSPRLPPP